jgi:hypothetical protein
MNYTYIVIIIILFFYLVKRKNQETFTDLGDSVKKNIKEPFDKRCTTIYGNYHPRCTPTSRLKHIGYFKYNTIKYPLLDFNTGLDTRRYVMFRNKFVKLKNQYWNRGYYFRHPFYYNKNVPLSFIIDYSFRGIMLNQHTKKQFFVFGRRINKTNYKYVLFRQKDDLLQYAYNIPYRSKLSDGDSTYIRNQISTYGPFVFYKP